jgi:hypothetical protein
MLREPSLRYEKRCTDHVRTVIQQQGKRITVRAVLWLPERWRRRRVRVAHLVTSNESSDYRRFIVGLSSDYRRFIVGLSSVSV